MLFYTLTRPHAKICTLTVICVRDDLLGGHRDSPCRGKGNSGAARSEGCPLGTGGKTAKHTMHVTYNISYKLPSCGRVRGIDPIIGGKTPKHTIHAFSI